MDCRDGRIVQSEFLKDIPVIDQEYMKEMNINPTPLQRVRGKVGRRELCPCGSGKKFKNCCEVRSPKR